MTITPYKKVFKRLETDKEFIARLGSEGMWLRYWQRDYTGEALDEAVWSTFRKQRRIIEDVAK